MGCSKGVINCCKLYFTYAVYVTIFACICIPTQAATLTDVMNLRRHLFETNQYDKLSRPMQNQSVPTQVRIGFSLSAIFNLDEVSQTLKTAGHLHVEWLDEALRWNSTDFGGVSSAMYPQNDVWLPDVSLKNSLQDYQVFGHPTLTILVTENGTVLWQPHQVKVFEPQHEISSNVVCAGSKGSDQPAHTRSLIRAFASRLNIL